MLSWIFSSKATNPSCYLLEELRQQILTSKRSGNALIIAAYVPPKGRYDITIFTRTGHDCRRNFYRCCKRQRKGTLDDILLSCRDSSSNLIEEADYQKIYDAMVNIKNRKDAKEVGIKDGASYLFFHRTDASENCFNANITSFTAEGIALFQRKVWNRK